MNRTKEEIENLPIGTQIGWKFGLCTRSIYRKKENLFEIDDTSDGWTSAYCNLETMKQLVSGEKSLLELNWS